MHAFLYDMCNAKLQLYAMRLAWSMGEINLTKIVCSTSYMLNSRRKRVYVPYLCPIF